jgi:hypothetical protein
MSEHSPFAKALFVFLVSLPYAVFRFFHFFTQLPVRTGRTRSTLATEKHIQFERVGDAPLSVLEMVEGIHHLRIRDGQRDLPPRPSMLVVVQALWDEETSPHWKIPTVSEVMRVRTDIAKDYQATHPCVSPPSVWAISEESHTFVACNLLSGEYQHALPKDTLAVLRGKAPDSQERCIAYAVCVTYTQGEISD